MCQVQMKKVKEEPEKISHKLMGRKDEHHKKAEG